jgi:formate dehydrogenase subunit beta
MSQLDQDIRETIANWLRSGEIELFIGYEKGTVPLRATPAFVRKPEDVDRLIWDATCENNLVTFLNRHKGKKVGIMVKGCDSRAIVGLLQEGQLLRENLRIVGVSCPGVIDVKRVAQLLDMPVEDIDEATLEDGTILVRGQRLDWKEAIFDLCRVCAYHNPEIADVRIGQAIVDAPAEDPYAQVREMEALDDDARWERTTNELQRCNLCYACRNACPLCYCNTCFADRTMPRWFGQTSGPEDIQFFQIIRTFHLAGRCVGCGACTRACPQGVNLSLFLDKLRQDVVELYSYEAGTDPKAKPPLTTFREDDDNSFVM